MGRQGNDATQNDPRRTPVHAVLRVAPGELGALALSGAFFFFVLFGYFMIRPVREAMGVERGFDEVRNLFYVTAGVSLVVAMIFGGLVHRLDRRRFIAVGFLAVIACLIAFAAMRAFFGDDVRGYAGRVFYVWLSVTNMFLTSVFWAFMADVWSAKAAKRLFPIIAVGGTLGAIAGSTIPWWLSEHLREPGLMLAAAACFAVAIGCMRRIDTARSSSHPDRRDEHDRPASPTSGLADGVWLVIRSPYLLGIGAYIGLMAISSTIIYFTQIRLVADASEELTRRIALFGKLDLLAQIGTLLVQLFVTARLVRLIGVGGTLAVLPIVTVLGFAAMHAVSSGVLSGGQPAEPWLVFGAFAVFQAVHRASRFAVARPAREMLFAGLSRDETYKAKPVVDLFVYRGGDVAGARIEQLLVGAAAISFGGVAVAVAPGAALWLGLGVWLGLAQSRRIREGVGDEMTTPDDAPEPSTEPHPGKSPGAIAGE